MMLTRSQSASASARMWLDSSTVRPVAGLLADAVLEHRLHQRVETRGGLVEEQQLDLSIGAASAATRATFCRLPLE